MVVMLATRAALESQGRRERREIEAEME